LTDTKKLRTSRKTSKALDRLRERLDVERFDTATPALTKKQRSLIVRKAFGLDKGKIKRFW
jgi:hypothetical protein